MSLSSIEKKAINFAKEAHKGVYRKFSGEPYFDGHVILVYNNVVRFYGTIQERVAALLHDTVEDVEDITYSTIESEFGYEVADLVEELTSDPIRVKEVGKDVYLLNKMLGMSPSALKIKLCDRLCNISDMFGASEKFRNKYYKETRFIIDGLWDRELEEVHIEIINEIQHILDEVNFIYKYESNKFIKTFESFKVNRINLEDIIKCIDGGGVIYADIVKEYPDNDPQEAIRPVSVDDDGLVTVEIDGGLYYVNLDKINRIEY